MAVCVWLSIFVGFKSQSSSFGLRYSSRPSEAETFGSAAEDGVSWVDSKSWAALEGCWLFVGMGCVQATRGLDNTVSLCGKELIFSFSPPSMQYKQINKQVYYDSLD